MGQGTDTTADGLQRLRRCEAEGLQTLTLADLRDLAGAVGLPKAGRKGDVADRLRRLAAGEIVDGRQVCAGCASSVVGVSGRGRNAATTVCPRCGYERGSGTGLDAQGDGREADADADDGGGEGDESDPGEATPADGVRALAALRDRPRAAVATLGSTALRQICARLGLDTTGERSEVLARVLAARDGGDAWRPGEPVCGLCRRGTMRRTGRMWRETRNSEPRPIVQCRACGYRVKMNA